MADATHLNFAALLIPTFDIYGNLPNKAEVIFDKNLMPRSIANQQQEVLNILGSLRAVLLH